jgi:predicted TIM-barrel fold metal-dependent hydrolase
VIDFDCHAHVFERVAPSGRPRYVPDYVAPLATWRGHLDDHGLCGGVLVQPSFLGFDNEELLRALGRLDLTRFGGVAVVDISAGTDLPALARAGIRGLRWNLVQGAAAPELTKPEVRRHLDAVAAAGLHLEIHLESPRLARFLPDVAVLGIPIVVDHFGLPVEPDPRMEPWLIALRALPSERRANIFVKFSAPYRSPVPLQPHAKMLLHELGPARVVWGSDWPWTRHESAVTYAACLDTIRSWGLASGARDQGAAALYRLAA